MIEHLRQATQESGKTQVEIAARLNKTPSYLSKILNRQQAATLIEIRNICRAANIPFVKWVTRLDAALKQRETE